MEEKKSRKPFLAIAAAGGLAAAALFYTRITDPVPKREYAPKSARRSHENSKGTA